MSQKQRLKLLSGLMAILAIVAVVVVWNALHPARPAANDKGYYTGPMLNKAGTFYTDDQGNRVPTPPGAPEPGTLGKKEAGNSQG
jgi:hypothetical protein